MEIENILGYGMIAAIAWETWRFLESPVARLDTWGKLLLDGYFDNTRSVDIYLGILETPWFARRLWLLVLLIGVPLLILVNQDPGRQARLWPDAFWFLWFSYWICMAYDALVYHAARLDFLEREKLRREIELDSESQLTDVDLPSRKSKRNWPLLIVGFVNYLFATALCVVGAIAALS